MQVEQTLRKAFAKILPINKCIYECGNAYVFTIKGYPNRIVKFNHAYDNEGLTYELNKLKYCATRKNPSVVKIHKYGQVMIHPHGPYTYYVMEKLIPLNDDDENIIIDTIITYYSGNKKKSAVPSYASRKLQNFIKQANKFKYSYEDVHGGNIMLDKRGNFKFIDLESFVLKT